MNWILTLLVLALLGFGAGLYWQQVKADRAFREFLNRNGYPVAKEDE